VNGLMQSRNVKALAEMFMPKPLDDKDREELLASLGDEENWKFGIVSPPAAKAAKAGQSLGSIAGYNKTRRAGRGALKTYEKSLKSRGLSPAEIQRRMKGMKRFHRKEQLKEFYKQVISGSGEDFRRRMLPSRTIGKGTLGWAGEGLNTKEKRRRLSRGDHPVLDKIGDWLYED